jgi:transposase
VKNQLLAEKAQDYRSERWMDFHTLKLQGLSIRKIAALRGVSRNAVRRALRSNAAPTGKRRRERHIKLAPFVEMIDAWLRDPVTSCWTAARIFDEIQDRGYDGGSTVLREYVSLHRPKPPQLAEARFYVKPGQQLQIDWAEMGEVCIGGVMQKVYAFVAILAWSRKLFACFTTDMELLTWIDCHQRAFAFFGGVPQEALIDNLKTGVISRAGATIRWQPKYEEFLVAMGVRPIAHFPRRPKTKGRVERIVRFVRQSFFVGRELHDLESFNREAEAWLRKRANTRVHRVTRERPCDRFEIEAQALRSISNYDAFLEETRKSDAYALVAFNGVRYSLPAIYARCPVTIHCRHEKLTFLVDGEVVAMHPHAEAGVYLMQTPEHLPPKPQPRHERFHQLGCAVIERFGDLGERYVAAVEQRAPHMPLAVLREVLERENEYDAAIVAAGIEGLLQLGLVKHGILSTLCYQFEATPKLSLSAMKPIPHIVVEQRSLAVYDEVVA